MSARRFNMFGRTAAVLVSVLVVALVPFASATAEPVQRVTFTVGPLVFVNPCNENELLVETSQYTFTEKDTFKDGSEHFLRQALGSSTLVNLTSGDIYKGTAHSTNIFHWPNELGEPPLIYIFRANVTYVLPGSGMQIRRKETIRTVVNPDGTIVFDVFDRTVTCR